VTALCLRSQLKEEGEEDDWDRRMQRLEKFKPKGSTPKKKKTVDDDV
jgi:hypothetical protein